MRKRRQKSTSSRLDFRRLEDRRLLAGDLTSRLQVANDLPTETNLIANGDFEQFELDGATTVVNEFATAGFFAGDLVTGWNVTDGDGDGSQRINLLTFDNDRGTVLDLDSIPNQSDRINQDVLVEVGQQYLLAFDFLDSPQLIDGALAPANEFEVYWNGDLVGSYTGIDRWQSAAVLVTATSSAPVSTVLSRLEFRNVGAGDGRGAVIDCVRLSPVSTASIGNGSFELVRSNSSEANFQPEDVENWGVFDRPADSAEQVIRIDEYQANETPVDGSNYFTLNSSATELDEIFQELETVPNATYYVTFDLRQDPSVSAEPDQLRVRWNDAWAATFVGTDDWQSYGILLDADAESTLLSFREPGDDFGDGSSPQIDNVQVYRVTQVINDLVVDANGRANDSESTAEFVEDSAATQIAAALEINHDSGEQIDSATVSLLGGSVTADEALAVTVGTSGISSEYSVSTGVLELQGDATISAYEEVLQTLTYVNTSDNFAIASRQVAITVADSEIVEGDTASPQEIVTVTLTGVNDAPVLNEVPDASVDFGEVLSFNLLGNDVDGSISDYLVSADGLPSGIAQPTVSSSGLVQWTPGTSGTFELTATAVDTAGEIAEQTFDVTIDDFVPFAGTGALSNVPTSERNAIYSEEPPFNIVTANTYDAVIDTNRGEIRIRLLDNESPTFVNNFVNLARDGFYDGLVFHRVIDGFVAQGGDPLGVGNGGPGYVIPDEVGNAIPFDSRGQLAYANSGSGTTGSQFFVTFSATGLSSTLFSVFGNVTSGDDVLDLLTRTQVGNNTPIPGAVPDVINSITIVETSGDV